MNCPNCNTENAPIAQQCVHCGVALTSSVRPAPSVPPLDQPMAPQGDRPATSPAQSVADFPGPPSIPYLPPGAMGQVQTGYPPQNGPSSPGMYPPLPYPPAPDIMASIIPVRNPKALIGYYLAVFSVIPFLGILLGIGGFVLGVMGLKEATRNPAIKGKSHAWVAILVGGFFGFGYLILTVGGVIAAVLASSH